MAVSLASRQLCGHGSVMGKKFHVRFAHDYLSKHPLYWTSWIRPCNGILTAIEMEYGFRGDGYLLPSDPTSPHLLLFCYSSQSIESAIQTIHKILISYNKGYRHVKEKRV